MHRTATTTGLEPATSTVTGWRSTLLSYAANKTDHTADLAEGVGVEPTERVAPVRPTSNRLTSPMDGPSNDARAGC